MLKAPTLLSTDKKIARKDTFLNSELEPKDKKKPQLRKSYADK